MDANTGEISPAMALLADGVPLSLLLDLAALDISLSRDLVREERADATWVHSAA